MRSTASSVLHAVFLSEHEPDAAHGIGEQPAQFDIAEAGVVAGFDVAVFLYGKSDLIAMKPELHDMEEVIDLCVLVLPGEQQLMIVVLDDFSFVEGIGDGFQMLLDGVDTWIGRGHRGYRDMKGGAYGAAIATPARRIGDSR